tara:strand:- start:102 stop:2171 length:2070 start_codon:yes stop_codon:yes gene_type:complete
MAHSITLQNVADTAIVDNDILGQVCFAAPNEAGGTDSILIAASMFARSEGTFAADNNATELVFVTAASESAAPGATNYDMSLSSGGNLTLAGNLELGHASDTTIARSSAGVITVEGTEVILAGAVTGITSLLATDIKIGEDDQTKIDFETANQINFYADNTKRVTIDSTGLTVNSGSIETATIDYTDGDNAMTIADGGKVTFAAGFDVGSDAAGDILYHNGTNYVRLGIGSDGQVLTVNDAANAPGWENASGGGASSINDLSDCLVENNSIFLGNDPSSTTLGANYNIALGTTALEDITTGDGNVAIGYNASKDLTTGTYTVAIGYEPNEGATTYQSKMVVIGYQAGESSSSFTNRSSSVLIGNRAGKLSHVQNSVIIGSEAGQYIGDASNTEVNVVAIGSSAMSGSSSDVAENYGSVGVGYRAGKNKGRGTAANYCLYLGFEAGYGDFDHASNMLYIANDEPSTSGAGGTIIKADMENKHLAIGQADLLTNSAGDSALQVYPYEAADEAIYAKMPGSHSGDLIHIVNNSDATLFKVDSAGEVQTPKIAYTDGDDAITINDGGSVLFAKSINQGITSATEDATVVIDLSSGNYFNITLGANVTDIDFTNGTDGQRFLIRFTQPAGNNYSIAYNAVTHDQDGGGSPASVTIKWAGGIAHTMTRTNAKADTVGFIINDENAFDGFIIGQNI